MTSIAQSAAAKFREIADALAAGTLTETQLQEAAKLLPKLKDHVRQLDINRRYNEALLLAREAGLPSLEALALAATGKVTPADPSTSTRPVKPKYRDPVSGALWSGRGKMPAWLQARVDAGETPADFLLK